MLFLYDVSCLLMTGYKHTTNIAISVSGFQLLLDQRLLHMYKVIMFQSYIDYRSNSKGFYQY